MDSSEKNPKIAIFHDYFRVIGGAEKLVLLLAEGLGADIITAEADFDVIKNTGFATENITALGNISKFSLLLPSICRERFSKCDMSEKYDFFIFSGSYAIYAAKNHKPNTWYCHTPLKGLYEKNTT